MDPLLPLASFSRFTCALAHRPIRKCAQSALSDRSEYGRVGKAWEGGDSFIRIYISFKLSFRTVAMMYCRMYRLGYIPYRCMITWDGQNPTQFLGEGQNLISTTGHQYWSVIECRGHVITAASSTSILQPWRYAQCWCGSIITVIYFTS